MPVRLPTVSCCCLLLVAGIVAAGSVCGAESFDSFLTTHCIRCHGPENEEGTVQLDQLSRDFKSGVKKG
jgi:hypothetical protein